MDRYSGEFANEPQDVPPGDDVEPTGFKVTSVEDDVITLGPVCAHNEPDLPDTTYDQDDVIAVFHKVTFTDAEGDLVTTKLRIVADEYGQLAEYEVTCKSCETVNWIGVGSPSGEYRCSQCTWWL